MTQLERERQLIKHQPKNFANFKKLLISHASMLEVYEYVKSWEKDLQQLKEIYKEYHLCEYVDKVLGVASAQEGEKPR